MGIVEDKIYDFVMDYVDAPNRAKANSLLNNAFDLREEGDLTLDEARATINKLIDLAKPEEQAGLQEILEQNRGKIEKYLTK